LSTMAGPFREGSFDGSLSLPASEVNFLAAWGGGPPLPCGARVDGNPASEGKGEGRIRVVVEEKVRRVARVAVRHLSECAVNVGFIDIMDSLKFVESRSATNFIFSLPA
jgi:hypothetical protein